MRADSNPRWLLMAALTLSCSSPGVSSTSVQPTASAPGTAITAAADPGSGPTSPRAGDGSDAALCQAVLDLPSLARYFHAEVAGRVPVVIVRGTRCDDLPLSAAGAPVLFRARAELAAGAPALELTAVEVRPASASVRLSYPIEGVVGSVELERTGAAWSVTKHELAER